MIDTTQLLDAGKRYIAAEQAFEQAKKDLDKACSEYGRYAHETSLPIFIWDHGRLYLHPALWPLLPLPADHTIYGDSHAKRNPDIGTT